MRRVLKWVLIVVGVVGLAAIGVVGFAFLPKPAGPKFLTAAVSRGRVETVVNSTGTVKAVNSVSVGAFVSGPIAEVLVNYNSEVQGPHVGTDGKRVEGDTLAIIDDRLLRAIWEGDKANLASQTALLKNQTAEWNRVKALRDKARRDYERGVNLAYQGWRAWILDDSNSAQRNDLPDALMRIVRMPAKQRAPADRKALELALRQHFDDKLARREHFADYKLLDLFENAYISSEDLDLRWTTWQANEAQVELAEASIAQATAAIKQAEAKLRNSKDNLDYTVIRCPELPRIDGNNPAPVRGIVVKKSVEKGQTVASQFQTPELFVIAADLDKWVDVQASVDEADIGMIRQAAEKKQPVTFTVDSFLGELFPGEVQEIRMSATTVQNVVTYPVLIRARNPKFSEAKKSKNGLPFKLMPDMTANITFHIEAKENVLRVPAAALRYLPTKAQVRPEDQYLLETAAVSTTTPKRTAEESASSAQKRRQRHVWIVDGNLLRAVPVTLGLIDRQVAEVLVGELTEGQPVVTGFETAK